MRRWWGGLRVAGRMARRDARRAKGRTALVAVLVGLPVLAGSAGAVVLQSSNPTNATYARWVLGDQAQAHVSAFYAPDLNQDPKGTSFGYGDTPPDPPGLAMYEEMLAAALPADDELLRVLRTVARLATPEREVPSAADVVELPADGDLSSVFPVRDGMLPTGPDQVALNEASASLLMLGIGDILALEPAGGGSRHVTVSGILAPSEFGPDAVVGSGVLVPPQSADAETPMWGSIVTTPEWYALGPEPIAWDDVLDVNALGSVVISRTVLLDLPPRELAPGTASGGLDAGTLALVAAIGAMALLEAALLIGPAFAVGARRQQRQLALLAAAGAEGRTLRQVVLLTGVVTGLAASIGATVGGVLLAVVIRAVMHARGSVFSLPDLRVPWLVLLGVAAVGTLAATMAAWLPARHAARVDVVAALAGRRADAQPRRRVAVIGVVVFAAGSVAAIAGAVAGQTIVLVVGVLALETGMVAASGALVGLAARLAPRLGAVERIAVRDAARNRSRTAPAVAAVIAAVAGITAGALYSESSKAVGAAMWTPMAAVGTVMIQFPVVETGEEAAELVDATAAALRANLPVTDVFPVYLAVPLAGDEADPSAADVPTGFGGIAAQLPPEQECPLWADDGTMTAAEREAAARDERCRYDSRGGSLVWMSSESYSDTLVDDGTVVSAIGLADSPAAARALARGWVVVGTDRYIRADGTARVEVAWYDPVTDDPDRGRSADLKAAVAGLGGGQYDLVLPPAALDELGLTAELAGLVAPVSRPPTPAEEAATVADLGVDAQLLIARDNPYDRPDVTTLVLVIAALVVGLGATGTAVVLAAVESRPDLATLAAIGAEPRTRRRFTAAQAGVVSLLGGSLGIVAGLMLGWVLVIAQRYRGEIPDLSWQVVVPWAGIVAIAVGIPLLAMAIGYLATRSRLPLVRRIAT